MTDFSVQETIPAVGGFTVSSVDAGLRKQAAPDVTLIVAERPVTAAGVFTTNHVKAAPVLLDQGVLAADSSTIRAVLINAACANACTGELGMENARTTQSWVAEQVGCTSQQVLVMSTGVIGVQLNMPKMQAGIQAAAQSLRVDAWAEAAAGIMTTDTKPKAASLQLDGYTIAGIAKGAGMIAPNMATMLSCIVTDAAISPALLQQALSAATQQSFNCVVIDGDMSTNDTLIALASGASGVTIGPAELERFTAALTAVCVNLAQKIVRDGEGATRFITINVKGAATVADARLIANTIATSPLVKTAFYGGDANWGRILAAAGRAGVTFDQRQTALWYDDLQLVAAGTPLPYDESRANALAGQSEVSVTLDLGSGPAAAVVWTCDLSHDYVSINGHYRT